MTPPCVVPTFRPYTVENLEFGGFYASSCESRASSPTDRAHKHDAQIRKWPDRSGSRLTRSEFAADSPLEQAGFEL